MIRLQELTPDDWQLWRELRLEALAQSPDAFATRLADWQGEADREDRWRDRLSIRGSHNVIAWRDEVACGMASGVPGERVGWATLISMWVAPPSRGCGVGDALIAHVVRWARDACYAGVGLEVAQSNVQARRLYQRHGFELTEEVSGVMPDGVTRELVMTRSLAGAGTDGPSS